MNRWSIDRAPNFLVEDAGAMVIELILMQNTILHRGVSNEAAYAALYAKVFGDVTPREWVHLPAATIAAGITQLVRQVGLLVLRDDAVALQVLAEEATWKAFLPPVRIARVGPAGEPIYTPSRQWQLDNRSAFEALVHRAAALAFAERLPSVVIADLPRTIRLREVLTAVFGSVIAEASARNDGTMRTLRQIQTAAWQLIDQRYGAAQDEGLLVLSTEMPSLVCAHLAYREAKQAWLIRQRNPTAHPNFMPAELDIPAWP